jgi:YfiH family protein
LIVKPWLRDRDGVYRVPAFNRFEWLEHGFGTRLAAGWPDDSRLVTLKQIHSAKVVTASNGAGRLGEGDALITAQPGLLAAIRTADCVPILLLDAEKRIVAAVHAGWRGTAQQIAAGTISELKGQFGTLLRDVYAAIGPAIGPCCYQVGPEVAQRFTRWWPALEGIDGPTHLDLVETNRRQLIEAGVPPDRVSTGAPCTACTGTLHSFRRDKDAAGRMISAIGIR